MLVHHSARNRRRLVGASGLAAAAFVAVGLAASRAEAIPAFSREFHTECGTCHTVFPQRNEFGEAFRRNGYVWPGARATSKKPAVPATEIEKRSAEMAVLSGLPSTLPISLLGSWSVVADRKADVKYDTNRYNLELLAGGNFGNTIGFWFTDGLGSNSSNEVEVGEILGVWHAPFGSPLNVRFGKFTPELGLWKSNRLTGTPATLNYTVNGINPRAQGVGAEVGSVIASRGWANVGVIDRDITPEVDDGEEAATRKNKEFYGNVGVKIGGADYRAVEPEVDLDRDSVWDFLSVELGAFGYQGAQFDGEAAQENDYQRFGAEAGVFYKRLALRCGASLGTNEATDAADDKDSKAYSAELSYQAGQKLAFGVRYDYLDVDGKDVKTNLVPAVIYLPLQSFKITLSSNTQRYDTDNTTVTLRAQFTF